MQLINKVNKEICFSLCVICIFSKCAWVVLFNDKKDITVTYAFQKILGQLDCKLNKIQVDKDIEFYKTFKRSMKLWLQDNHIEIHLTNNEAEHVVAERFNRILKNTINQ